MLLWSFEGAPDHHARFHNFGGLTGRETPLPIPNREVKPARADGTRRATSRESRSPPINFNEAGPWPASLVCQKRRAVALTIRSSSVDDGAHRHRRLDEATASAPTLVGLPPLSAAAARSVP